MTVDMAPDHLIEANVSLVLPDGVEVPAGRVTTDGLPGSAAPGIVFRYAESFLLDPRGYDLSPDMPRSAGPLRAWSGRESLGALGDAMPDSWGRRIIRAGTQARSGLDYLLHVNDETRQGALRFAAKGTFLGRRTHPVAQVHDLPRIFAAARAFETGTESDEELAVLIEAGTSAGGARPKAVVRHHDALWMAKFARDTEYSDPMAWEATALALARQSGVETPAFELERIAEGRSILLTKRFDRVGEQRIGYLSAHSLTTKPEDQPLSYVHLAEAVAFASPTPRVDLAELFRRVALSLLIGNVDDHFRNHGFLRQHTGWKLSPVFDLEPNRRPDRVEATPITEGGERYGRDIRELRAVHDAFRLSATAAASIIRETAERTMDWRTVAIGYGISPEAAVVAERAFDGDNRHHALEMPSR
ncbi:type II toxin-antitoxin system HipA family toxin [Plantibacter sp. CFBP 8804]|uniref:type II toxin-antitoxin system HipA family toxin n=1 Tax=Plantibacter sp. CFBP 8804 TaxID=2775270 RepID=UPI00178460DE|nr:type II toxin-antitoxin system HipA family toxin [Plantibacter sp. CFBP 8804]MBD8518260.1 type II toxin-antitoxin system HipA family toxin [Plantibacter sp. CFBP 8804]